MPSPGEHYLAAEAQLQKAFEFGDLAHPLARARIAVAQVHATLATVTTHTGQKIPVAELQPTNDVL